MCYGFVLFGVRIRLSCDDRGFLFRSLDLEVKFGDRQQLLTELLYSASKLHVNAAVACNFEELFQDMPRMLCHCYCSVR